MQKCVTIYSNIYRTTHKYGNILQMKIVCTYNVKIYPQLDTNRHHACILQQKFIKQFV